MKLDVYSHGMCFSEFDHRGKQALYAFCGNLAEFEFGKGANGKLEKKPTKTYFFMPQNRQEFRFHIALLDKILIHLSGYGFGRNQIRIVNHEMYTPAEAYAELNKDLPPDRDYQEDIVDFAINGGYKCPSGTGRIVTCPIQMGKGKGRITMRLVETLKQRVLYTMRAEFIHKWMRELLANQQITKDDVMFISGGSDMDALIKLAKKGDLTEPIILIGNPTMRNYIKDYELHNGGGMYDCVPHDLCKLLGVGVLARDEAHLDHQFNYKMDTYMHVPLIFNTSATITPSVKDKQQFYFHTFPQESRYTKMEYDQYIDVTAFFYSLEKPRNVRYKPRGRHSYSQIAYEQYIMKNPVILRNYLKMIEEIVRMRYVMIREQGQKYLIFANTVLMCTHIKTHLKAIFKNLKIVRYVSGDNFDDFLAADIGVSTLKKSGAAIDIKNLRASLMTDAIDSQQTNEQALGRTRPLIDFPEVVPEFHYLVCPDIPRQTYYHKRKREFFKGKVLSHKELQTPFRI